MKLSKFGQPLPAHEKRLILGEPTQQLFPLKYHWMWEHYKNAQANHWTPEDVAIGTDRADYLHQLTDEERWMYDWCLSMLTTQDLVVMANLEEGIERHLTVPEASMYLARQTDEESIHTWSYQLLVEALSLDENVVYERYLREPSLYAKVEFAHEFHRRLLELRMDDHSSTKGIGEFMICIAFWSMVMEGGWFYNGFNFVYALRDRGLMAGSAKIFQYIQRDEALHMDFWIRVLNELIKEYPEAYTRKVQQQIAEVVAEGAHLEQQFAEDTCNNVMGISAKSYMDHYRHRTNATVRRIGIQDVFPFGVATPMPWVSKYELLHETNFFEGRVHEYRKGGLGDWGDNADPESVM